VEHTQPDDIYRMPHKLNDIIRFAPFVVHQYLPPYHYKNHHLPVD
jgi:hypothetical protein